MPKPFEKWMPKAIEIMLGTATEREENQTAHSIGVCECVCVRACVR